MAYSNIFSSIEQLCAQQSNLYKQASDGMHSTAPDDPTGDGTVEPKTGDLYSAMDKEIEDYPFVDVTAMDDGAAYDNDVTANLDNIGTEVTEFDEGTVDRYTTKIKDPGTSSQVKFSSAAFSQLSFGENQDLFTKAACVLLQDIAVRYDDENDYYPSDLEKQAYYTDNTTIGLDRYEKANAIINEAVSDAELFAKCGAYILRKNASGEAVGELETPDDAVATVDAEAEVPEEAVEALADLSDDEVEALASLSDEDLAAVEALADAVDNGDIDPEDAMALLEDTDTVDDAEIKEAYWHKQAVLSDLFQKAANVAPVSDADVAATADLDDSELAAIDELDPEALEQLIALDEAVQSGEIPPEVAANLLQGDSAAEADEVPDGEVSEDEAVAELSSAMADQGVTPEDLEAVAADAPVEKAASLRQIARGVRSYRTKYAAYTRSKTARSAAIRRRCKSVLDELMN